MTKNEERYAHISYRISDYRRKMRITQAELAELIDMSLNHVSRIENPNIIQPVSLKTLFALADAFGIPVRDLLQDI